MSSYRARASNDLREGGLGFAPLGRNGDGGGLFSLLTLPLTSGLNYTISTAVS